MPSDNEVMVLIYETVQKQLNQIKDTRVVLQSLANRVSEVETTTKSMYERTADISERVGVLEEAVAAFGGKAAEGLEKAAAAGVRMKDATDAMRSTLENVTNPSISLVSGNHAALKEAVRDLKNVHGAILDEFEQYELRMLKMENTIEQLLKNRILAMKNMETKDDE